MMHSYQRLSVWGGIALIVLAAIIFFAQSDTRRRVNGVVDNVTIEANRRRVYVQCNERRRIVYINGELTWFNALHEAEMLRLPELGPRRTHDRRVAYAARAKALRDYLKIYCGT